MVTLSEVLLVCVPYIALIVRVWMGANMIIHGYAKIMNFEQTAQQTNKSIGIPIQVTGMASILEFLAVFF